MAGTNLLSAADKVLPTIIGVVSFLGALRKSTLEKLEDSQIKSIQREIITANFVDITSKNKSFILNITEVFLILEKKKLEKTKILLLSFIFAASVAYIPFLSSATDSTVIVTSEAKDKFSLSDVPKYKDQASVEVHGNKPYFTKKEKENTKSFENYHKLDKRGRCGVAYANVSPETMPTEARGAIGSVKPTGWHTVKYNGVVDGNYLYNRCHLIAYCLTAENANKKNLITGTRYLNIEGMLPYETMVAKYVEETGNHVLYRVTPIFKGNNLLASGVLMEGYSVEDNGKGICYCVYAYNVQPGIKIDYKTGDSKLKSLNMDSSKDDTEKQTYIVNTNTKKFHKPSCASVKSMSERNKKKYNGYRKNLINNGYEPCKNCNPQRKSVNMKNE